MIKLADKSELGWKVVSEYESNPLASDSDDEKRMYKAEARASRKFKAEKAKKARVNRNFPYRRAASVRTGNSEQYTAAVAQQTRRPPGLCFACGKPGHWKGAKECGANISNNKISNQFMLYACKEKSQLGNASIEKGENNGKDEICSEEISGELKPVSDVVSPVGRLGKCIDKWKLASDSDYIIDVVQNGYKLPFKEIPEKVTLKNNRSARENSDFVEKEINSLLKKGVISESQEIPWVVNPLTVAYNRKGKPRLVLDCRHINPHLHNFKVKFEDIKVAEAIFEKNSFLFTYDLKGAYHHIDIFSEHRIYLGFSHTNKSHTKYYVFNSLPFGIKTAGHIFTKMLRVVVTFMRKNGHKIIMFLDDGIGGHNNYNMAVKSSSYTKQTLGEFGFLLADEKCNWIPSQTACWLGHDIDMKKNMLFITKDRIERLEMKLKSVMFQIRHSSDDLIHVKILASIVGQIISLQNVIGNLARLRTRELFNCINSRASWNAPVKVTNDAWQELKYWIENARTLNERGKYFKDPYVCAYTIFVDASATGYGGYVEQNQSEFCIIDREHELSYFGEMNCYQSLGNENIGSKGMGPRSLKERQKGQESVQEVSISCYKKLNQDGDPPEVGKTNGKKDTEIYGIQPEVEMKNRKLNELPEVSMSMDIEENPGNKQVHKSAPEEAVMDTEQSIICRDNGKLPEVSKWNRGKKCTQTFINNVNYDPPEVGLKDTFKTKLNNRSSPDVDVLSNNSQTKGKNDLYILKSGLFHDVRRCIKENTYSKEFCTEAEHHFNGQSYFGKSGVEVRKGKTNTEMGNDAEMVGNWSAIEQNKSSTWRETEAVSRIVKTYGDLFKNKCVKVYSDNKNVKSIINNGSRKSDIQSIALDLNDFCDRENIKICTEWIPREGNEQADYLSRCHDSDDWEISRSIFDYLDRIWGKHTMDRFASHFNSKCRKFNSRWWVPGTEAVDAMVQSWKQENNWLVPPPRLVASCLEKIENERAVCTLIIPKWKSASFWPCLFTQDGIYKRHIKHVINLHNNDVVVPGKGNNGIFAKNPLSFDMLAIRIMHD